MSSTNFRTIDNDPISHFNDPRISVEMYPDENGSTAATVSCSELGYSSGLKQFATEQEANLFAINLTDRLTTVLDSKIQEAIIRRLIFRQIS